MSVSGISNNTSPYQFGLQSNVAQPGQTFAQLGQALQAGDLSTAQSDYAALQQFANNAGQTSNAQTTAGSTTGSSASSVGSDFSSLGQALQSGNLTSAQSAFTQLQQDIQTASASRRRHHHMHSHGVEGGQASNAQSGGQTSTGSSTSSSTGASTNSIGSDFSSLGQALQSGNLTGAQSAFTQLQQDIQTACSTYFQVGNASGSSQTASASLNIMA
jgi:hypothetical protein